MRDPPGVLAYEGRLINQFRLQPVYEKDETFVSSFVSFRHAHLYGPDEILFSEVFGDLYDALFPVLKSYHDVGPGNGIQKELAKLLFGIFHREDIGLILYHLKSIGNVSVSEQIKGQYPVSLKSWFIP